MKIKLLTLAIFFAFASNSYAQTSPLYPEEFAKTMFEIIKTDNFEKLTTYFLTEKENEAILDLMVYIGETKPSEKEKMLGKFKDEKRVNLANARKHLTKAIEIANESGIILSKAKYVRTIYEFGGISEKFAEGDFIIVFDYLGLEYKMQLRAIQVKNEGWKFIRFDNFNDIDLETGNSINATEEASEEAYEETTETVSYESANDYSQFFCGNVCEIVGEVITNNIEDIILGYFLNIPTEIKIGSSDLCMGGDAQAFDLKSDFDISIYASNKVKLIGTIERYDYEDFEFTIYVTDIEIFYE